YAKPWIGSGKNPPSREQAEQWVLEERECFLHGTELSYFVFKKPYDTLVGRVTLTNIDWSVPKATLSCWTRSGFQRSGIAIEFLRCISTLCFESLKFQRLELYADPCNEASIKLA